ncbi:MAG: NusG domain II-containing protein [Oscillospiraceae bacterium]|nr:NusG domain II-containing protein [Oscillospiraceae bacterium]
MTDRALITKRDIRVFAALLVFALAAYAFFRLFGGGAEKARISVGGRVVQTADLNQDAEFSLEQNPNVRFAVRGGAIAFIGSDCPDKVCVRSGYLKYPGQTAACLPNRAVIFVTGASEDTDIVAY